MRDDFTQSTKELLAKRVGFRCSNPKCNIITCGPAQNGMAVNIGVAAHITAASPNGPRYDETMTPEERKYIDNGIWLCQNCAKIIDSDVEKYTVKVLKTWKKTAEANALMALEQGTPFLETNSNFINNTAIPEEISSGKMLKKYFFEQIIFFGIPHFLSCDTKAVPLLLGDIVNADIFIDNIYETLEKCSYSCYNIEGKKSYKNICTYIDILKTYNFLLACLCTPHPYGEYFYIEDINYDRFININCATKSILNKIIEAIKNKDVLSDSDFFEWNDLINNLNGN